MKMLSEVDKLIITEVQKREELYSFNVTKQKINDDKKYEKFFEIKEIISATGTQKDVKEIEKRWKEIRDTFTRAHVKVIKNQNLTKLQKEIYVQCYFLQEFVKHKKVGTKVEKENGQVTPKKKSIFSIPLSPNGAKKRNISNVLSENDVPEPMMTIDVDNLSVNQAGNTTNPITETPKERFTVYKSTSSVLSKPVNLQFNENFKRRKRESPAALLPDLMQEFNAIANHVTPPECAYCDVLVDGILSFPKEFRNSALQRVLRTMRAYNDSSSINQLTDPLQ